jgi:hypothetical protein
MSVKRSQHGTPVSPLILLLLAVGLMVIAVVMVVVTDSSDQLKAYAVIGPTGYPQPPPSPSGLPPLIPDPGSHSMFQTRHDERRRTPFILPDYYHSPSPSGGPDLEV